MRNKVEIGLLALDIGARKHATSVSIGAHRHDGEVENTIASLKKYLLECIAKCIKLRVIMEATGIYYLDVALLAADLGAVSANSPPFLPTAASRATQTASGSRRNSASTAVV